MTDARELLYVDFDGRPTDNPDTVVGAGLGDPRHAERVPLLAVLMNDRRAAPSDRLYACVALTEWGEAAGYHEVVQVTAGPGPAPWYGESIDRKFSVDNTFAMLAVAVRASRDIAATKGTGAERLRALAALVRIADREYFDEQLEWAVADGPAIAMTADVERTVRRGVERLEGGQLPAFDLGTQLVDLTVPLVEHDEALAVDLAMAVLRTDSDQRVLEHAAEIVREGDGPHSAQFGDYLAAIGGARVQALVADAAARREPGATATAYFGKITPGRSRTDPAGVVRRRTVDAHLTDEAFTRRLRWEPTTAMLEHRFGHDDTDYVGITPSEAAAFVEGIVRLGP